MDSYRAKTVGVIVKTSFVFVHGHLVERGRRRRVTEKNEVS